MEFLGGSLPRFVQVSASQDGRVATARLVDVEVLRFSRKQLLDRDIVQRSGARPATIRVRLHLRERVLDLSAAAVLVAAPSVFVAVPFLAMRAAVLMGLPIRADARMDVSEVEGVRLGEVAKVELDDNSVRGVLEGGGAAYPGVALWMQVKLRGAALVGVVLPCLGATDAAPYQQEDGQESHDAEEYRYPPHVVEDTIRPRGIARTDYVVTVLCSVAVIAF
jgi:hypothetical protein